jgi:hypothetical protein
MDRATNRASKTGSNKRRTRQWTGPDKANGPAKKANGLDGSFIFLGRGLFFLEKGQAQPLHQSMHTAIFITLGLWFCILLGHGLMLLIYYWLNREDRARHRAPNDRRRLMQNTLINLLLSMYSQWANSNIMVSLDKGRAFISSWLNTNKGQKGTKCYG